MPIDAVSKSYFQEPNTYRQSMPTRSEVPQPAGIEELKLDGTNPDKIKPLDEKKSKDLIGNTDNSFRMGRRVCEFKYHEKINRVSIKIMDEETGEVIREIPPEETLRMIEKMWEVAGILFDEKR